MQKGDSVGDACLQMAGETKTNAEAKGYTVTDSVV
jgi:hypothetical protein